MPKYDINAVAANLKSMGFKAEAKTFTRKSGEVAEVVDIDGFSNTSVFIDYSHNAEPELKIFVNLEEGYAFPERDQKTGRVIREKVMRNGKEEWDVKRGAPLTAAGLARYKKQTYARTRAAVAGPAVAAHLLAANGGDVGATAKSFGLTKYERDQDATNEATNEGGDPTEGAFDAEEGGAVSQAAAAVSAKAPRQPIF